MRRPLLALLGFAVAATVACATPSWAESGHKDKVQGDAPAAIDITGIDANNAVRRVKVKLEVPGLTEKGSFTLSYENDRYDGMAIILRQQGGRVSWQAWHCNEESCSKVGCAGVHARWNIAGHYVSASVPQRCYPLRVPKAWNFNGHSDLGRGYDSAYTRLRLSRG